MKLSNKTYDVLKIVAWIFVPLASFVSALCIIWGVPMAEQITATLTAFNTLLGALLHTANKEYYTENETQMFNEDLLKDMLGFNEDLYEEGVKESEE